MIFIHDTRDKAGKHQNVDDYLTGKGHKIIRSKLFVGDVTLLNDQSTVIDLKQNLLEVVGNVAQQHERFTRECIKANENGIHLIILVEHGGRIKNIEDVKSWRNPRLDVSPYAISGERLYKIMRTYEAEYGVEWMFCDKRSTGRIIESILAKKEDS